MGNRFTRTKAPKGCDQSQDVKDSEINHAARDCTPRSLSAAPTGDASSTSSEVDAAPRARPPTFSAAPTGEASSTSSEVDAAPRARPPTFSAAPSGKFSQVVGVTIALERLRRKFRSTLAFRRAMRCQEWKLFTAFDQFSEQDDLRLATFMRTVMQLTSGGDSPRGLDSPRSALSSLHDHGDPELVPPPSMLSTQHRPPAAPTKASYDPEAAARITIESAEVDAANFKLPLANGRKITPKVALQIIDVCRNGGRCSQSCMLPLLRQVFRAAKEMPNITRIELGAHCRATIVGDLHGQLQDLLHILDTAGLPGDDHVYCFNGDWVDRGKHSVEVITIIFALFVAYPGRVALNRGNHEDAWLNSSYGFKDECDAKYPWINKNEVEPFVHQVFLEVFKCLPLFTVINSSIFVVHGGLFEESSVTLSDLDEIPRAEYDGMRPLVHWSELPPDIPADVQRSEFLKQLMREALWSDPLPHPHTGIECNPRGSGVLFGADVAAEFMARNGLKMIVRSHECIDEGIIFPYLDEGAVRFQNGPEGETSIDFDPDSPPNSTPLLCTLFSASNYTGTSHNKGAFLTVLPHKFSSSTPIAGTNERTASGEGLHFRVTRYRLTPSSLSSLVRSNRETLQAVLIRFKSNLLVSFQALDGDSCGEVSRLQWSQVMASVTAINIRWLSIIEAIVPSTALCGPNKVAYAKFISAIRPKLSGAKGPTSHLNAMALHAEPSKLNVAERLYSHRKKLEVLFRFFDANGDGQITMEEFKSGVERLKHKLSVDSPRSVAHRDAMQVLYTPLQPRQPSLSSEPTTFDPSISLPPYIPPSRTWTKSSLL